MKQILVTLAFALAMVGCEADGPAPVEDPGPGPSGLSGKADSPYTVANCLLEDGAIDWGAVAARCAPPAEDEEPVYLSDFEWGYSLERMATRFDEIYASGKRLDGRSFYDEASDAFVFPQIESWGGQAVMPRRVVENVRMHIEKALARGYADFIFFPDMGHSHYFIPMDTYQSVYAPYSVSEHTTMLERLLDDPELKVLYHTAEQLQQLDEDKNLLPDRHLQWRFFTRNVVGDNDWNGRIDLLHEPESAANTSHDLEGHYYYGAGFYISAVAEGCFPYVHEGKVYYFDISFTDMPYETTDDFMGY